MIPTPATLLRGAGRGARAAAFLALGLALAASSAAAQGFELGLGFGWTSPRAKATYVHAFEPRYLPGGVVTGSGGQTLTFRQDSTPGFALDLVMFTTRHFGFRVSYDPFSPDTRGGSTPYQVAIQTPAGNYSATEEFHALSGKSKSSIWSVDALYRVGGRPGLALDGSLGVSALRSSGTLYSANYSRFDLKADGSLRRTDQEFMVAYGPKTALGANAGLTASIFLGEQFGLGVDVRYFAFTASEIPAKLAPIPIVYEDPWDPATENLSGKTVKTKPAFLRLCVGIRMGF